MSVKYDMGGFSIGVRASEIENAKGMNGTLGTVGDAEIEAYDTAHAAATTPAARTALGGAPVRGNVTSAGTAIFSDATHTGLGASFATGPFSFGANYGKMDYKHMAMKDVTGTGLSAGYDLGGGAKLLAGYGRSKEEGAAEADATWSLGLKMAF